MNAATWAWMGARVELPATEEELTWRSNAVVRQRQAPSWVRVDARPAFDTDVGIATLADLVCGRSKLLVYRFVFGRADTGRDPWYVGAMRWLSILVVACLTGCASYRYELVRPAEYAGKLDGSDPRWFEMDPLQYTVATAEDRLSIQVYNPAAAAVRLSGRESYIVDPDRRSHPLIDQTIAPLAYVRVVLPPLRPWAGATDYVESSGIGTENYGGLSPEEERAYGNGLSGGGYHGGDPGYDRSSPVYWDWPGTGEARVHLVYRRADGTTFAHDLAFRRIKA